MGAENTTPTNTTPTNTAPTNTAPTDTAPTDTAPTNTTPTDTIDSSSGTPGGSKGESASTSPVEGEEGAASPSTPEEAVVDAAPSFDWEGWDGDMEKLPAKAKKAVEKLVADAEKRFSTERDEAIRRVDLWNELLAADEDPRVIEANRIKEEIEEKYNLTKTEADRVAQEYAEYKAAVELRQEEEMRREYEALKSKNPEVFNDKKLRKALEEILDDPTFQDAQPQELVELVTWDETALAEVRDIVKRGDASVKFAMRHVQAKSQDAPKVPEKAPKPPSKAKAAVAGSTSKTRSKSTSKGGTPPPSNLADKILYIAERNLRK